MKKIIAIFLTISLMLTILTSCTPAKPRNIIREIPYNEETMEIISLLQTDNYIDIYEIEAKDDFEKFEMWIEVYEKGEFVDKIVAFDMIYGEKKSKPKKVSIITYEEPSLYWTFNVSNQNGISGYIVGEDKNYDFSDKHLLIGKSNIDHAEIIRGEEIELQYSVYADQEVISMYFSNENLDPLMKDEKVDALMKDEKVDFLYIIKCKFS